MTSFRLRRIPLEYEELLAVWQKRQARLRDLLERHGATDCDYHLDFTKKQFLWVRRDRTPVVAATPRLLLTYALSTRSILMGWANRDAPEDAVERQEGVTEYIEDASEEDAWEAAMRVALRAGAEFLYRAPSPQLLSFLGLWDVRRAAHEDLYSPATSSPEFVRGVLDSLRAAVRDVGREPATTKKLFVNQGLTFLHRADFVDREAPYRELERDTGNALVVLGESLPDGRHATEDEARAVCRELERLAEPWKAL